MALPAALLLCLLPQQADSTAIRPADAAMERRREEVDRAVERGLAWLAAEQGHGGGWTGIVGHKQQGDYVELSQALRVSRQAAEGRGHMGVTALAGLAFLAGGHLPGRGRYGDEVQKTLDYVLDHVAENGVISDSGTRMYSHAFATLFLAEVYGMAGADRTKIGLERAVNIIVDSQNLYGPDNQYGAWRYNAFSRDADLSVTVCQVQALRAARNIGIQVPRITVDRAVEYVKASRKQSGRDAGLYYYKIYGRSARTKPREYAINAAALTALVSAGIYDEELYTPALRFLVGEYPYIPNDHFYYWYGNYYASQAFFHTGGERFKRWYDQIQADLLATQAADGAWINRVGPGDAFSTAVACIILQIPKQYLPIFQR